MLFPQLLSNTSNTQKCRIYEKKKKRRDVDECDESNYYETGRAEALMGRGANTNIAFCSL